MNLVKSTLIVSAFTLLSIPSFGCLCTRPTIEEAYQSSEVIIIGEVISVEKLNFFEVLFNGDKFELYRNEVTLKVTTNLKNGEVEFLTLYTGLGGGDCGFKFELGKSYIVYANKEQEDLKEFLSTDICTRTSDSTLDNNEILILKELSKLY